MKFLTAVAVILATITIGMTDAASILWTGYANNNQWDTPTNWYPAQIPGAQDDVTIHTGVVQATTYVSINSLLMGDHLEGSANLTIYNGFNVFSQLACYQNGNILLESGSSFLSGAVTIQGGLVFSSGSVSGSVTVTGLADLSGAAAKTVTGGVLALNGASLIGGVVSLTQSGNLTIAGSSTWNSATMIQSVNNTNGGFDFSKGSVTLGADASIQANGAFGTLTIGSAANLTIYNTVAFASTVNIPNASAITTLGSAVISSVALSGSGSFFSSGASTTFAAQQFAGLVACEGASCVFSGAANAVGNLVVGAGTVQVSQGTALSAGLLNIINGAFTSAGTVSAAQLNFLGAGSVVAGTIKAKNLYTSTSQTFTISGGVVVSGAANLAGATSINFGQSGMLKFGSNCQAQVGGVLSFSGPPNAAGFSNDGAISIKNAVSSTNINLSGKGTWTVTGSTIAISGAQFAAATLNLVSGASISGTNGCLNVGAIAAATVKAKVDSLSFQCSGACSNVVAACNPMPTNSFSFSS